MLDPVVLLECTTSPWPVEANTGLDYMSEPYCGEYPPFIYTVLPKALFFRSPPFLPLVYTKSLNTFMTTQ